MDQLVLSVPMLYADHHVLKVREALAALEGIGDVYASSAWRQVMLSYDPGKIKPADVEAALARAGYAPGAGSTPELVKASPIKRDPQWASMKYRVTETNEADLKLSGEFRRY